MDFFLFSFAFLVLHILQSEAAGNEPVCSKFSYEEQLLGKITRVEIQVEEWDKHLKKFEETVLSVLGHRREEMENIVENQNKKIEKQSEKYGKRQDAQNKKLEEISLEQNKLWDELERRYTPIVAFNAYSTRGGVYPANKILNFANVLLNEGDGYNATSGYFTAPITGLYQFTAHVCSNRNCYFVYAIVHEDTTFALSTIHEDKYSTCASVGGMVEMKAGERVSVKSKLDASDLLINTYRRPSFMGVLLRRKI